MILRDFGAVLIIIALSTALVLGIFSIPREVKFIRVEDGTTVIGEYIQLTKTIKVVWPDGEVLQGEYVIAENITAGFLFFPGSTAMITGFGASGGAQPGYALLKGDKGTVMEIIFTHSIGHGFGEAKTNKGDTYKVMF